MSGATISSDAGTSDDANKSDAGYAGDISVSEAWAMLSEDANAVLVDVRSGAEWNFVGTPDLSTLNKEVAFTAWQVFPGMALNAGFVDEIKAQNVSSEAPLLMLCRSGVRSKAAAIAMTSAGYGPCFNIAGGFEGDADAEKHRGLTGGWKAAGLPWTQS